MKEGSRANALLIELLLVILFFMLTAMTLVKIFGGAKVKSIEADSLNHALQQAQNISELLYGSEDPEKTLEQFGFTKDGDAWILEEEKYQLKVVPETEETKAGTLLTHKVSALFGDQEMFVLPESRYLPGEVAP